MDVPIFIFFCTEAKPRTPMEKILSDRDDSPPNSRREAADEVEHVIEVTRNSYASYGNIHVFSGNGEVDVEKLLRPQSEQNAQDECLFEFLPVEYEEGPQVPE